MAATMIECPKCSAAGRIRAFDHVEAGVCFLCRGARKVTEQAANRWFASQHDRAPVGTGTTSSGPRVVGPTKIVDLPSFGDCRIERLPAQFADQHGNGPAFEVTVLEHDLRAAVYVVDGRVLDADQCMDGLKPRLRVLIAELQARLAK